MSTGNFIFILIMLLLTLGVVKCNQYMNTPEYKAARAAERAICLKPQLVSEIDGVRLYVINPPDMHCPERPVYFSKSGTKTTHTERRGKTTHIIDDEVSNAGE